MPPSDLALNRHNAAGWIGLIAWSGLIVFAVYGSSLDLPFLADDFFQMPYVSAHSLTQIWQAAEGLYYFRPLSFTLWKLAHLLLGLHDPAVLHALNLLLHWANGLLVAWLAGQLWSSPLHTRNRVAWRRRYLSATLFLVYPFSYEAVPWIAAVMHPLATTLVLLSLASYLQMRSTKHRVWGMLSLALTFLGSFAHENGVLVGFLIAIIELTRPAWSERLWLRLRRAAVWTLPALLWYLIWRGVPTATGAESLALNSIGALLRNGLYFAQGAAYPLAWLGGWLRDSLGASGFVAAAGLSALALVGGAFVQWRGKADRRAWLPWLWIGLTAAPAVFFLSFSYVSAAPRVLMLSSVGIAWLWADVFLRLADAQRATLAQRRLSQAIAACACAVVLIQNLTFIRSQMQLYELSGSAIRRAVAATEAANNAGRAAVFINLPVWITWPQTTYAIGQEGVVSAPAYDQLETLVSVHTGQPARISTFRFDAIRQDTPYYLGLMGAGPDWSSLAKIGGRVFLTHYGSDEIRIESVGELAAAAPAAEPIARFGSAVTLLDATASIDDAHLHIDLAWQVLELPLPDVTVFVHVLNAGGQLFAQADGDPLAGTYPFWQWTPGLAVRDRRAIEVSGSGLSLRVGLYDRATGERLAATSADGAPIADNAVPISIQPAR